MKHILLPILCLGSLTSNLSGQDVFLGFWQPQILYNLPVGERWQLSASTFGELFWVQKEEGAKAYWALEPFALNLQAGAAYQLTADLNLSLGYRWAWRDLNDENADIEHRLQQQVTFTERLGKFRLRGRARAEQRFFREQDFRVIHRLRLQPSVDFPLQGTRLDPGELYLNASLEWLFNLSIDQSWPFRETRPYLGLGWELPGGQKLENGLEWRTRQINNDGDRLRVLYWRLAFIL